ncbi:hypothetical protein [uncultured Psychroserpens sp.]|uniref:hypothetical protein n=1 Tax=uncultured Psychroserpens sp. TaxID=255436 RepID=UPI0026384191|nr:hypothetical protein [uncultured Psychroserpens sp.]
MTPLYTYLDWINTSSQVIMAATAVITAVIAYRTFLKTPDQEEVSVGTTSDDTENAKITELTVFLTSKQETTLKIGTEGLICSLKDTRPNKGGIQWVISKAQAARILESKNYSVNPGYKASTGTFNIGIRRNWLYSKKLFSEPDILLRFLTELLQNTVNP